MNAPLRFSMKINTRGNRAPIIYNVISGQSFKVNNEKWNLANWTGCLTPPTEATAPACIVDPSIIEASISTWPNTFRGFFVVPFYCCTWDPYLQSVLTLGLRWRLLNPPSPSQQPDETRCTIKKWNWIRISSSRCRTGWFASRIISNQCSHWLKQPQSHVILTKNEKEIPHL